MKKLIKVLLHTLYNKSNSIQQLQYNKYNKTNTIQKIQYTVWDHNNVFYPCPACGSMGQQMDFFSSFSSSFPPPILLFLLGTENAVGGGGGGVGPWLCVPSCFPPSSSHLQLFVSLRYIKRCGGGGGRGSFAVHVILFNKTKNHP